MPAVGTAPSTDSQSDSQMQPPSSSSPSLTTVGQDPDENAPIVVNLRVSDQTDVQALDDASIASCVSQDPNTVAVLVNPCTIAALGVGTTSVTLALSNGSTKMVSVNVVAASAQDPGDPPSGDGAIPEMSGVVCVGGPACDVTFVLHQASEAAICIQTANSRPCANDPSCGAADSLHVCNCTCSSAATLPFADPSTCQRFNPFKPGNPARVPECHAI